jgi:hypothetical protein
VICGWFDATKDVNSALLNCSTTIIVIAESLTPSPTIKVQKTAASAQGNTAPLSKVICGYNPALQDK